MRMDFFSQLVEKEIDGAKGNLSEFLEDVALATDMDKDTDDEDRVALMTIHLVRDSSLISVSLCVLIRL